jgi:sugar-specific transcriptional regulator TrmB
MDIQGMFLELGFSEKESQLYLALSSLGPSGAQRLAKHCSLPRTTVYTLLGVLIEKGIIQKDLSGSLATFRALPPEAFLQILEAQEKAISHKKVIARKLAESVKPKTRPTKFQPPLLFFVEGQKKLEKFLIDHYAQWQKSLAKHDHCWWGYNDHTYVEKFPAALKYHWQNMLPTEKVCIFSNESPTELALKGRVRNREIKKLGNNVDLDSCLWVVGDYIVFVYTRDDPPYAFEMLDARFARTLRAIFRILWHQ